MSYGKIRANFIEHNSEGSVDSKYLVTGSTKVWGFTNSGMDTLQDSFNVTSITDHATGQCQINFTNNMDDNLWPGHCQGHNSANDWGKTKYNDSRHGTGSMDGSNYDGGGSWVDSKITLTIPGGTLA